MLQLPPISLYIHIPWCIEKCPYCDFNSHKLRGQIPEQAYLQAMLDDLNNSESMPSDNSTNEEDETHT